MHHLINKLILYRNCSNILNNLKNIFNTYSKGDYDTENLVSALYDEINAILILSTEYGFNNNLWNTFLTFVLIMAENPFTLLFEKNDICNDSLDEFVKNDFEIFKKLFDYDFGNIEKDLEINCFTQLKNYKNKNNEMTHTNDFNVKLQKLSMDLSETNNLDDFYNILTSFYKIYGVGIIGLNRAFKISNSKELLIPITSFDDVLLDDIVGYKSQKDKLVENTEAFVRGKYANNVLLYGDAGTGKSTSVKAILNEYYDDGLRIIEVYKHETKYLSQIINKIKNRNYRFILYMDDLSFEESESEYKYLKALIEGGIETNPNNVIIYATSNRRHLIRETWNERTQITEDGDMYESDTVGEKLSLVNRFGLTIAYYKPSLNEYYDIVIKKARRHPKIKLSDDELKDVANKWVMSHGAPSGRAAEQLIIYLLSKN